MNENITPRLKNVLKNAKKEATKLENNYIGTEHVVIAIIDADRGLALDVLKKTNVALDKIKEAIFKRLGEDKNKADEITYNKELEEVLIRAKSVSEDFKHTYVGTEHVFIAILEAGDTNIIKILKGIGLDPEGIRNQLVEDLKNASSKPSPDKIPAGGPKKDEEEKPLIPGEPYLKRFSIDLTEKASKGELDPVVGRTAEIDRVIHILSRKKKNNPVLVGPPGVGKTSIAEGLALRIFEKKVPKQLLTKKVFALDMAQIVAGTVYRGQFEERIKKILKEAKENKDYIIFIDELHTVIGAGSAEGTMDASNMIKPALARGELNCVGATTEEEHRKYIERDAALERRFQKVIVDEPNVKDTLLILSGAAKSYETFHGIKYTDDVLTEIVGLSNRFITDRFQPDKSFDIMDEAGSRVKLAFEGPSENQKDLETKLAAAKIKKGEAVEAKDLVKSKKYKDEIEKLEHQVAKCKLIDEAALTVKVEDVYAVVSSWTGIPVGDLGATDKKNLMSIDKTLGDIVVGQHEAVQLVTKSLKKYRTPLRNPKRPMGNFLFCGPTGVGKSLLAKTVALKVFGSEKALLELDMSEYMDSISASKLIGSSAGYVGYEDGSKLCKFVQRRPYSVILFDEIEKAHPDVIQLLLQILEEGRLTDNHGKIVNFKNTIIILTSNLGSQAAKSMGFGTDAELAEKSKDKVLEEIKKTFKPEFLNRLHTVVFNPLTLDTARNVVDLEIGLLNKKLEESKAAVQLTQEAKEFLLTNGFNQKYGARNVRQQIETHIEDALTDAFLSDQIPENSTIIFDVVNKKLTYQIKGTS